MDILHKIIAVVGPTASGKSSLGITLAQFFGGEILAVDSRTVYRGMNIGTAKPAGEWQTLESPKKKSGDIRALFGGLHCLVVEDVPHWGFDLADPDEDYNVSLFKQDAKKTIQDILHRGHIPILVGGTGLWFDALVRNLEIPEVKPDLLLRQSFEERHVDDLFAEFKRLDPDGALVIDRYNKRRLVRALEVCHVTGSPFSELRQAGNPLYDCLWIGLDIPREELYQRIDTRVDEMVAHGFVTEVRHLYEQYGCEIPSMSGIGYQQICRFFQGKESLKEAIEDIKQDTRHYAKRQLTWFRRNSDIHWVKGREEAMDLTKIFFVNNT